MSALAEAGRALTGMLSSAPLIDIEVSSVSDPDIIAGLALLEDLLDAKRLMPTEYRMLRALVLRAGESAQ